MQLRFFFLIFIILTVTPLYANDLQNGLDAIQRGNHKKAFKIFKPLANEGNAIAQDMLGELYQKGQGVKQDYLEAAKFFKLAAAQGSRSAQYFLGKLYQNGQGVKQDYLKAIKWLLESAQQGHISAQFLRQEPYYKEWVELAAEQGDSNAQIFLGANYYLGLNVSRNYSEAIRWYKKAAEQGSITAHNILGAMHEKGKGTFKDYVEARKWFAISDESGDSYGHMYRKKIEKKMDPSQIKKSKKLAKKWLDQHEK